ncbi:hypothetical protein F4815DRAFT_476269 [Daldinia loculata]|nr:hypothetical protein F4815DRAFT_476269 [Daldinia loculata]
MLANLSTPNDGFNSGPPILSVGDLSDEFNPIIILFIGHLEKTNNLHALDQAIESAYQKAPRFMDTFNIIGADSFLKFANDLLKWIPHEGSEGQDVYNTLCMFYFVFNQSPLKELQTPITPDASGRPLTWLSSWLVVYSQLVGLWMDTTESLTEESLESFKQSKHYNVDEALPPPGGWKTFNEFFSRQLKADARPIESPLDDKVIVYLIKNLPWTIGSLLQGSEYADEFNGGVWIHGFLNTYNPGFRQLSPPGPLAPIFSPKSRQFLWYRIDTNSTIAEFMQTRGLIIINNAVLGKVAVLPIGMAVVSSVKLLVRKNQQLKKGDEISTFLFGGSDIVCVFQRKAGLAVESFVPSAPGKYSYSKMGSTLANAP